MTTLSSFYAGVINGTNLIFLQEKHIDVKLNVAVFVRELS